MLKPDLAFQASASMTDSLEFIKKLWGGMAVPGTMPSGMAGMPGMVLPTFSVEELRKKISELRAVESWLELNTSMLRTTIQALEVQVATLSALQSMGDNLQAAAKAVVTPLNQDKAQEAPKSHSMFEPEEDHKDDHSEHDESAHVAQEPSEKDEADAAAFTAPLVNAATWWNQLQNQFQQAVAHALAEVPKAKASGHDRSSTRRSSTGARKSTAAKKSTVHKRKTTK